MRCSAPCHVHICCEFEGGKAQAGLWLAIDLRPKHVRSSLTAHRIQFNIRSTVDIIAHGTTSCGGIAPLVPPDVLLAEQNAEQCKAKWALLSGLPVATRESLCMLTEARRSMHGSCRLQV